MNLLHSLPKIAEDELMPVLFPFPFTGDAHPLCRQAALDLVEQLKQRASLWAEAQEGKMMGVLVVQTAQGQRGYLAAFSGTLGGQTQQEGFVPPVYDLMAPDSYFQQEEAAISRINARVKELQRLLREREKDDTLPYLVARQRWQNYEKEVRAAKERRDECRRMLTPADGEETAALIRESQFMKAQLRRLRNEAQAAEDAERQHPWRVELSQLQTERAQRSQTLQRWLHEQYRFLNAQGEQSSLLDIFHKEKPPGGAGDCCAPKLLQYAYLHALQPLCLGEFWVGASPQGELRRAGHFYAPCRSRCYPILGHMLRGLPVAPDPALAHYEQLAQSLILVAQEADYVVVNKPAGLLSVPGGDGYPSVYSLMRERYPQATGPLIVHRLDMDTSGLMLVALTDEAYHRLQTLFLSHRVQKQYTALLQHPLPVGQEGDIRLPLAPDPTDRPRQCVSEQYGRPAHTHYRVVGNENGHARVLLSPVTGRTHQLRVHCAHPQGLNNPILGDRLYGTAADRLHLHAFHLMIENKDYTIPQV